MTLIKHDRCDANRTVQTYEFKSLAEIDGLSSGFGKDSISGSEPGGGSKLLTEDQLERAVDKSFEDGYRQGHQAGYDDGRQAIQIQLNEVVKLLDAIHGQREKILGDAEQSVVDLTLRVVEKILGSAEIVQNGIGVERLHSVVGEALKKYSDSGSFNLRLSKSLTELFTQHESQIKERLPQNLMLTFTTDPTLAPGDCLVETSDGALDARIETELKQIRNALKPEVSDADR